MSGRLLAAAVLLLGGCGGGSDPPPAPPVDADPGTPQRPPVGQAAVEAWLAEGHFRAWACEGEVHSMRLTGNHGRHKICSNQALLDSASGPYPVGAASVKQLYTSTDQPNGFAVGVKIEAGMGPQTWYWYERHGPSPADRLLADGVGVPECAVCHATAVRDNVFIVAGP